MNIRKPTRAFLHLSVSTLMLASAVALATEPPAAPTKDMREKMAVAHEQMAACLRSDKTIAECRTEMMQKCQQMMGQQHCMGMGMDKGMGHMPMKEPAKDN